VPETREEAAARQRVRAAAGRRRQAVTMLQAGEATCRYGASVLSNGASPAEAAQTALYVAQELAGIAAALRKAVRPTRAQRRALAVLLVTADGLSRPQAARRLGVSERTIWRDLAGAGNANGAATR
jgi:DNA-binding NarL/FixJ family response regulator